MKANQNEVITDSVPKKPAIKPSNQMFGQQLETDFSGTWQIENNNISLL